MLWTLSQIADLIGGRLEGADHGVSHVTQDSRDVQKGSLFVPLKAARDGHEFAARAQQSGAVGAFWASDHDKPEGLSLIHVDDGLGALQMLGDAASKRHQGRRVAITGSVGKTTTKDMLTHVLAAHLEVHAAKNSFNNHIGVPLTLANMEPGAELGVFELGMSNVGEIAPLSHMVRPHIAMVTAIAPAHIGQLGSLQAIAKEKSTIYEGLGHNGIALVPEDAVHSMLLGEVAKANAAEVIRFGISPSADYSCQLVQVDETGMQLDIQGGKNSGVFHVGFVAPQLCSSIAAVYAVCEHLGVSFSSFSRSMAGFSLPAGRGRLVKITKPVSFSLLDDSYNANPSSMEAAINALGHHAGRKIAILGDMLELGDMGDLAHLEVVHRIIEIGVDVVVAVGPAMGRAFGSKNIPGKVVCADNVAAAFDELDGLIQPSDLVLVKGSHGSEVYQIVARLLEAGHVGVAAS